MIWGVQCTNSSPSMYTWYFPYHPSSNSLDIDFFGHLKKQWVLLKMIHCSTVFHISCWLIDQILMPPLLKILCISYLNVRFTPSLIYFTQTWSPMLQLNRVFFTTLMPAYIRFPKVINFHSYTWLPPPTKVDKGASLQTWMIVVSGTVTLTTGSLSSAIL